MATGLVALLDDVAGIAKVAASSLDDVSAAAMKASSKAAGVVIDDTAVTPRYVTGFTPDRELPIIGKIALGSIRNKLLLLLPVALLLSAFAPWAITPLLMLGGAFLCYEGAEKLYEAVSGDHAQDVNEDAAGDPATLELAKVKGAIRTDLILSAEIMAIALSSVEGASIWAQAASLVAVAVLVTVGVYGVVALIVKMDDIGLHLVRTGGPTARAVGGALVKGMPKVMSALSTIGTVAMLWVGGQIIVHGLEKYHLFPHVIEHAAEVAGHAVPFAGSVVAWLVATACYAVAGVIVGMLIVAALHFRPGARRAH